MTRTQRTRKCLKNSGLLLQAALYISLTMYPRDTFTYAGAVNLTLDCTATSYQNANWTIGEIYSRNSTFCSQDDVTISPYLATAVA